MDVLVTGGGGFIGGHLAERLVREGHNVTTLDSMHPYYDLGLKRHNLELCRDRARETGADFRFVEGDVRNQEQVTTLVQNADSVYHHAARAGVRDSVADPRVYDEVNVDGTLNVLDAARDTNVDRVVVASSSSVYGGREEYAPFSEADPTLPVSPYGTSKLAADGYARVYGTVYDLPTVVLRYFTVYGPRMRPNMAISNFVSRCLNGEPPVVYGDGEQTRDFTYIDDVVDANTSLLYTDEADGKVLNVGSTDTITINELADLVIQETGAPVETVYDAAKEADARHTHADVSKANEIIGYDPQVGIREGVSRFVEWYRANREWYEPLVLQS